GVARGRKYLNHPSFSFDAATMDLLYPLMAGGEIHILQEEVRRDLGAVYRYCLDNDIYGMTISTAMGMALLNQYDMPVHYMMLGGEKLLQVRRTEVRLINGYGPTEFTVCSSYHVVDQERDVDIPIGRPVPNSWSVICDADGQLLPQGMVGELCLIGPQIAEGYWQRPEVTQEKFCRIRFEGDFGGDRMYRTGDLARYNADGELEFCGRIDFQVKLRGFRIELGEIEACASSLEGVTAAVAEVRKVNGQDTLCLYYTADREISVENLRGHLSGSLTSYMVPDCFVRLDEMPLTPNGKVNRKALPEPAGGPSHEYEAPRGKDEKFFCETFSKGRGAGKGGATDNFFDIGGTSIVAMRIVAAAGEAGYQIAYKDVFDNPTPRDLAGLVRGSAKDSGVEDKPADEVADYDYSAINRVLAANTMENFKAGTPLVTGNALVTGATGYLGIHVLHELARSGDVDNIYCLVRAGHGGQTPERRLRSMLFYYFNDDFDTLFKSGRLTVIDGDVTRPDSLEVLLDKGIDTVFNCAAIVKHFSAGTDIEDVNVGGTRCCIDFCLKTGARLIHTSTLNVAGTTVCESRTEGHTLTERELYWGQTLDNRYCRSKFIAERSVLEAVASKGLKAKIMRLGNLASRSSDGEFQINFRSNSSMGQLKAFQTLGCIPYEMITGDIEFSPIDEVSKAVVLLSRTPVECCVFHASTVQHQVFGNVIKCMNDVGIRIAMVENEEFNAKLTEALKNPRKADILQSMLAYSSGDRFEVLNGSECTYSAQVLLRLGFFWKFTTWDYIEQFLRAITGLGFFDEDYSR
ncbi:MAG: AMP-binding protein, partial [Bacteroidales bacterium]|nr:AMP-binding protein [Bacteroidales bacterium]